MRTLLNSGWELAAGEVGAPFEVDQVVWRPALVPGTVASSLRASGDWSFDTPRAFDRDDWWYRCRFQSPQVSPTGRMFLVFGGLATLSEVWLNGQLVLQSRNMFVSQERDVSSLLRAENELLIRFASLDAELERKRPRPRWKTRLVAH
ncbi:MAG TPA: glycoside hydrolase family 2 protein, partial [Chloroflexota bacterium]|nr:glycoside hydrolase family 2 protein [Chloroflexota bacterium]